jgi:hypothetical protein
LVILLASLALVNIPLLPVNVAIVTPAKIRSTMMVMTKAIKVIPPLFFELFLIDTFF